MNDYDELEVELFSLDAENYRVTLQFSEGVSAMGAPQEVGPADISINSTALLQALQEHDFGLYGRLLRDSIFAPPEIHALFVTACAKTPLRIKLKLDPSNQMLPSLRWELLTGPDDTVLSSTDDIAFSRYLPSGREVTLRREPDDLRALIVVVDPSPADREKFNLSEIDVDYDKRAASLSPIECHRLTSDEGPVTMNKLIAKLRTGVDDFGGYDILYLVCHGTLGRISRRPILLLDLETEEEKQKPAYFRSGEILVHRLAEELAILPRLVLLASCASAGTGDDNALSALGPLLATQGVPAVIAMQGYVQLKTIDAFVPTFFKSLIKNGEVDRAVQVARSHIKNEKNYDDWWMPALFMRLATGRIWYTPGFDVQVADEDDLWSRVTSNIELDDIDGTLRSYCTPILGPAVDQHLFGSDSSLASRWAREHHFPLAPYHQDQLPLVLQYLKVRRMGEASVRKSYRRQMAEQLRLRYPQILADAAPNPESMIEILWQEQLKDDPEEPHNILARLPFTCYITTSPTSVLEVALRHQGREPQVEIYNWDQKRKQNRARDVDIFPTMERPLVFHAFGHFRERNSLVLSEDDYYDHLISFIRGLENHVSSGVSQALTDASLLFLGFRLFRWDFRIVFRSLLSPAHGGAMLEDYPHVAAQLSPNEGAFLNLQAARYYLADYYKGTNNPENINLDIYWGETSDFLSTLNQKWPGDGGQGGAS